MATRTSVTASATRALGWTRRHLIAAASLQANGIRTRTTADHICRNTSSTARLSTLSAHHRQAQKPIPSTSAPASATTVPAAGSTPKQPSLTSKSSESSTVDHLIPIAQPYEQTLAQRIRFLSRKRTSKHGHLTTTTRTPAYTSSFDIGKDELGSPSYVTERLHNGKYDRIPDDNTQQHQQQQHPSPRRVRRKPVDAYRSGFKPGDFICPQCGTHNFRPPEYTQTALQQSTVVPSKKYRRPLLDQEQQQQQNQGHLHGEAQINLEVVSAVLSRKEPRGGRSITRFQREIIPPQRKYPQGAACQCFECGFQTSYTLPTSSTTTTTRTHTKQTTSLSKDQDSDASKTTSTAAVEKMNEDSSYSIQRNKHRNDIRVTKPRDYVCPECQTVNYNSRLQCVGCGVLAPWIQTKIEQGSPFSTVNNSNNSSDSNCNHKGSRPSGRSKNQIGHGAKSTSIYHNDDP
ncbi:MAG: hypothetical protein J3R72DRAFT_454584 [Linnemannia gamsii]|nr:MAG: hypothetical protein J3R72DRAFT_454584 [Linnemannia gamsii]